ncbi:C2 domain-containing protein/PRT_C domain-containing protein [Cephalotus follicularis]|uniref:C2 domain-containing protein/PRT_C domain-containing protein n=1 Tax=Cephalotus follicularis TaxID=3775 RepID=A0A1Q3CRV0_CEPFO|nr:C2 domain-containing protein/PRT_C domain-containing protein [Cephalotus follicularis]
MAETKTRKLIVEVSNAKNLMPKDGQGTASAYAIVDFDGQRRRTKTKFGDLNPQWDERLEFLVQDTDSMPTETLEINLYNDKKTGKRSTFLGKVKLSGATFVEAGSESLVYHPLEKRSVFSQIKGEIGLKVYYIDEDTPSAVVAPEEEKAKEEEKPPPEEDKPKTEESDPPPAADPYPQVSHAEKSIMETERGKGSDVVVVMSDLELRDPSRSAYDLVDRMLFLYVRVVKAKRGDSDSKDRIYAKLMMGTHSIKTKSQSDKDWDQVFAFDKDGLNSTSLEVSVWSEEKREDGDECVENCLGNVSFDLQEVPKRVPPDSPLAPQWYTLDQPDKLQGNDVMLAVWFGTQADEAFQEAWQSDSGGLILQTPAKVYLSPKLWYLRLTIIQTQDLQLGSVSKPKVRSPEVYVKGQLGAQVFKTGRTSVGFSSSNLATNPTYNEDLVFVAAEPFEPFLVVSVEDASNGQRVGSAKIHLASIERRMDDRTELKSRWFNLVGEGSKPSYAGRIHVRVCLEGGYHVLDEAAHVTSDVRAAAKQLAKPPIGLLEVGIRGATNLLPVKKTDGTRGTTDAYVVAKYGPKWVRTRTILDQFNPRWNEQYAWDVFDPCTVLTIGVFDNGKYKHDEVGKPEKDVRIGKIRVRLSTLDANRVYLNSYSLTALLPGGAMKMGEIEIAVRFSCTSWLTLIQAYTTPILPRLHYVRPMGPAQQDILRHVAMRIVTARLARSEPPLSQEVVQFMLDTDTHVWSMRRSKANWFRVVACLSRAATLARWIDGICTWVHAPTTVLLHVILVAIVLCPHLVLPTIFMYAFFILASRFRSRHRGPLNMDPRLSHVDLVGQDELDEEFDGFPTTRSFDVVRIRYDRIRALAGRTQTFLGDVAAQGERIEALFNWSDPRATGIFAVSCLFASFVLYVVPFKVFVLGLGFYFLRHPSFRGDMPLVPVNFFRRLPSLSDQIL